MLIYHLLLSTVGLEGAVRLSMLVVESLDEAKKKKKKKKGVDGQVTSHFAFFSPFFPTYFRVYYGEKLTLQQDSNKYH